MNEIEQDVIKRIVDLKFKVHQEWNMSLFKDGKKIFKPFTVHESLFHYTTIQGLFGIVESNCFWLTNIEYMNDLSETKYASELIKKMLFDICEKVEYSYDFVDYLKHINNIESNYEECYIACFSSDGDSLPMWIMYGKEIGVAIEIDLCSDINFDFGKKCYFKDMIYDEKVLYSFVNKVFDMYHEEYIYLKKYKDIKKYIIEDMVRDLIFNILLYKTNIKNKNFIHEKETRLLYIYDESAEIKYRVKNKLIIPYVEIPIKRTDTKKIPIKSIIVGPGEEQNIIRNSIKKYLESRGYNVEIKLSTIPYRNR